MVVLLAFVEEVGGAVDEDVPEALPVFLPVVDYEGDVGVGEDVADAFEVGDGGALGFLVEDAVEAVAVVVEADGYEVGDGLGVGGGEVGDPHEG